jgi:hypothetical protein
MDSCISRVSMPKSRTLRTEYGGWPVKVPGKLRRGSLGASALVPSQTSRNKGSPRHRRPPCAVLGIPQMLSGREVFFSCASHKTWTETVSIVQGLQNKARTCSGKGCLEGAQPSAWSCFVHAVPDCCRCCGDDSHRICCGTRDIEVSTVPESVSVPVP